MRRPAAILGAVLHALVLATLVFCFAEPSWAHGLVVFCLVLLGFVEQRLIVGRSPNSGSAGLDASVWLLFTCMVFVDSTCSFAFAATGGAVMGLGFALRLSAIRRLGAHYQDGATPGPHLVTGGVYRWIRHPGEIGMMLVALGVAITLASALGGLLWLLAMVPVAARRAQREERALANKFGARYQRYLSSTTMWSMKPRVPPQSA